MKTIELTNEEIKLVKYVLPGDISEMYECHVLCKGSDNESAEEYSRMIDVAYKLLTKIDNLKDENRTN